MNHDLHLSGIETRNMLLLVVIGFHAISSFVNAVGPRHYLIIVVLWEKNFCSIRGLIILFVILPITCLVFDGVGEKKYFAMRRARHGFHTTIFQKGCFEYALFFFAVEEIVCARCSCPYLRNIAVNAFE